MDCLIYYSNNSFKNSSSINLTSSDSIAEWTEDNFDCFDNFKELAEVEEFVPQAVELPKSRLLSGFSIDKLFKPVDVDLVCDIFLKCRILHDEFYNELVCRYLNTQF